MTDAFDVMGIEPGFTLDEAALHRRFIELSAASHPDRFVDPIEQADAAERAAAINEAYRTLHDPERRANALLLRLGGPAKEDDKSLPPDLLMQMMEIREEMEAAVASDDRGTLDRLRQWANDQRAAYLGRITQHFEQNDAATIGKAVRRELNGLRYIERMIQQMPQQASPPSSYEAP